MINLFVADVKQVAPRSKRSCHFAHEFRWLIFV
jgi:hypothetical protein